MTDIFTYSNELLELDDNNSRRIIIVLIFTARHCKYRVFISAFQIVKEVDFSAHSAKNLV